MRVTRRRFLTGGLAITGTLRSGAKALAAELFDVTHTDAEWRTLLTPDQYAVLRHEATRSIPETSLP
jgi:peptide-methionine (R)-S-oxide reductase